MRSLFTALAFISLASAANAAALDGTFTGSYGSKICGEQGDTKVLITFVPQTAKIIKAFVVVYDAPDSSFGFGTDILEYSGTYNPTKQTFSLPTGANLGRSNGFTYFPLTGTVSGNKIKIKWVGCGGAWTVTKLP